ncbi:Vacuolar protein-sorting protein BRO1 [Verticillium dahliae VDG1]|nr:Vacuolar protein-sorting protein BRO1 [Verticillium dahliae VDG1]
MQQLWIVCTVLTETLNRPSARNAISKALLAQLRAEIDNVHAQYDEGGNELPPRKVFGGAAGVDAKGPTRAVILASAVDTSFCAGADLKERRGFTQEETNEFLTNLRATFTSLSTLPVPTISAISSVALGGGLELALSTSMRVLSEAVRVATEICEGGPVAVRAALQAVGWAREEVENKMYERVVATEDRNEALKAFQEKRKPVFQGR